MPGYEDYYEVSDHGRVRSLPRWNTVGRVLKLGLHPGGYHGVVFSVAGIRKSILVHKLVLEAFVEPCPEGHEARHLDGDPTNNRLDNLAWGTPSENERDKLRHGTSQRGEGNGMTKLSTEQVREIIRRNANGESQRALAVAFGIHQPQVSRIVTGKRWGHLEATVTESS